MREGDGPAVSIQGGPERDAREGAASGDTVQAPPSSCSVLVPVTERPIPLEEIYEAYAPPLRKVVDGLEFIFVVPAWRRDMTEALERLAEDGEPIRVLEVGDEVGEASLLELAAREARSGVVLTLPAYHRVEPASLPRVLDALGEGVDLVTAVRSPRRDSWVNRLQNSVFHGLLHFLAGGNVHDTACGVRAMRREVLREVPLYGDYHRFLPVLAHHEGYAVREVNVPQHPEDTQPRLHDVGTYVRRLIDLLGLFFLLKFAYKPLRFFGLIGALLTGVGAVILLVLFFQRLGGQALADRPLLVLAVLIFTLGLQFVALGLIGEIIVHFSFSNRRTYRLASNEEHAE